MSGTKEKVLTVALRLFANDGYEAVSMREIAGQLGITKGALHKHCKSKRDIFDQIVERINERDAEQATAFGVPAGVFTDMPEAHHDVPLQRIKAFSLAMFKYWTEDEYAKDFRRMLTLEQYCNPEMADLPYQYLTGGVICYTKDLFREANIG